MKTSGKIGLGVLAALVFAAVGGCGYYTSTYNAMVSKGEAVSGLWAQVENQYQRRLDLIPNLVATVKGYAAHEAEVLEGVAEARARAGGVLQVPEGALNDAESFGRFQRAQSELSGALQRLLMVSENYPDLKANANFLALQDQLEGTENRIAVERNRFNAAVRDYNAFIRGVPRVWIAESHGFEQKAYFAADARAASAPVVGF
ncbi:MAG: LemA family protein [Spirochaetaceae bacterium]|jgi:LemA protein|nr:LemA family protein [Spirochaetaceae bacterium]